jgi:acyl-CoA hydrolase
MEIGIRVVAENIREQTERHTNSCYFTMVAMSAEGQSLRVEPLVPNDEEAVIRWVQAEARRDIRLMLKK